MPKKLTNKEFIQKANKVHNHKYSYPDGYVNSATKIKIICPIHGAFFQKPNNHLSGYKCAKCGRINSSYSNTNTHKKTFCKKANEVHNNKYEYPDEYVNAHTKLKIICPVHGAFLQSPNGHLAGRGCGVCSNNIKLTSKKFIKKANEVHNNKYSYPDEYVNAHTKLKIICPIHGEFYQRPHDHVHSSPTRCPQCSKRGYSQKAISWLNEIAKKGNIHIQHAENKGEYNIPTTNYKADGYCEANNTIYEFYGDIWHGNLELYNENEQCHPFSNESAGSLYMKTMQREQIIKDLGYNLITIWENEFKCLKN